MFIDYTTITEANAAVAGLTAKVEDLKGQVDGLTGERDAAREARDRKSFDFTSLKSSLQSALVDFADANLDEDSSSYQDLHDLMVDNGLDGLKKTFAVTVRVTYEFTVEVEASNDDAASELVDNNLEEHIRNEVDLGYHDDYEITDVEEA